MQLLLTGSLLKMATIFLILMTLDLDDVPKDLIEVGLFALFTYCLSPPVYAILFSVTLYLWQDLTQCLLQVKVINQIKTILVF